MKESLQRKVSLLEQNTKVVRSSAKLDFGLAANLGALLFTSENIVAQESDIRANRKILKSRTGVFNNMRGAAVNLALLSRMSLKSDPEAYLEDVMRAYDIIKAPRVFKGEELVLTAMAMVEDTDPADYAEAADAAWAVLDGMREIHPLLTNQRDLTLAHLLDASGIVVSELLEDAEMIYSALKPTGFKLNKDALQSVSLILALSDKPIEEKCRKFVELRDALRSTGRRIYGEELAILAAFADMDMPVSQIVSEIAEVDDALRHVKGYGPLSSGANLRRMYAAALVLQAYDDEQDTSLSDNEVARSVVSTVVLEVIMAIITTIIIMNCVNAANSSH